MRTVAGLLLVVSLASIACSCSVRSKAPDTPIVFNGPSDKLKATEIVPTLDTPIPPGKNAIWCASFQAAWKALEKDLAQEPISLEGSPEAATLLNKAVDPRPLIPSEALYVATGWKQNGIIEQIRTNLHQRFPGKEPPTFPGIADNSFVAYSYLEANAKFSLPYFQNRKPFAFVDARAQTNGIKSFGIRPEDDYAYFGLRRQLAILFRTGYKTLGGLEFAIDLCADSSPSQIVVARIDREPTLAAALARVEREANDLTSLTKTNPSEAEYVKRFGPNDVLLVPDLFWQIQHRFSDLERRAFGNPKLGGQRLDIAQQDILFHLSRNGAELRSESKTEMMPVPTYFVLDRPFLIYMKKRGAQMPYFVMWVDNAELLSPWQGPENQSSNER